MELRLNRELKVYCNDFAIARQLLSDDGAVFVETKEQVDYYYRLPPDTAADGNRRLKLRIEDRRRELIYYCEGQESGERTSRFQFAAADDPMKETDLAAALGVRVIVRKQRELWRKDNVIFNLDNVDGVGQILEVEVQAQDGYDIDAQLAGYIRLFEPCLGDRIVGSNEDLVTDRLAKPPCCL